MKKALILLMTLAIVLTLCSCGETEDTDIDREAGFDDISGDDDSGYRCGYKIEQDEYDLDNVTLQFFYGSLHPNGFEERGLNDANIIIRLFFVEGFKEVIEDRAQHDFMSDNRFYYIKEIDDFFCETYHCSVNSETRSVEYNFSEWLTIPKDVFNADKQYMCIQIEEYWIPQDREPYYSGGGGQIIYYKINGNKVILSSKSFES